MIKKVNLLAFIFIVPLLWGGALAQKQGQDLIDSLFTQLSIAKEDTSKVNLLAQLTAAYYPIDPEKGLQYGSKEMELAEKLEWKKGIGWANIHIGVNYWAKSDYAQALEYYFKGLKVSEELNDNRLMTSSLGNIGIIYFEQSNYPKALEFDLRAVRMFEEMGDRKAVARNLGNIAEVYGKQHNYPKALEYYFTALRMNEELGRKPSKALNLIGIGDVYAAQTNYSKALEYYFMALYLNRELKTKRAIMACLSNIGSTYLLIVKDNSKVILNERFAGNKITALQQAKNYTDSSIAFCKEIGDLSVLIDNYKNLSEIQEFLGDHKDALESYKNYNTTKDSVFNLEKSKKITQAIMQYEFDKKEAVAKAEQERKDVDAKRTRNLQYTAIAGFVLLAIFLFWNNMQKQKAKIKIEKAYAELKITQQQLIQSEKMASLGELTAGIAHEIQNPLNFVNNFSDVNKELLVEMKDEMNKGNLEDAKAIANDVIDNEEKINHHGKRADAIVKNMLQHSRSSSGKKELTDINALADEYLRLAYHGLRAKDKSFNADIKTDFDNNIGKINIIPQDIGRVVLNLINNAFYAVDEKKKQNQNGYEPTVSVSTKKASDKIEIKIKDNGNGIPQKLLDKIFQPFFTTKPTGQGTGLGLSLSYDIVKAHGGELRVETKEGEGTAFIIFLGNNHL
ncbi:MAG TPA: tetratricopeptide repeat protein [Chitinophagaceae bacterium]|nr:tetratricopeptide repeat protein [Chitinophagaceae bacterium]